MLEGCISYDLKQEVIYCFPKSCQGCVIVSMIMMSNRVKKPEIAIRFLKKLTNGWFNEIVYDVILQKLRSLFRHLKYNESLADKSELVCLRFTQWD